MYKLLTVFLVFVTTLSAQQRIDFSAKETATNTDYTSFYPALMLKHEIGRFYKIPKNPTFSKSSSGWDDTDVADPFVEVKAESITLFYDGSSSVHYSLGYALRDASGWGWK